MRVDTRFLIRHRFFISLVVVGLVCNVFNVVIVDADEQCWSNKYGELCVYPEIAINGITDFEQYCNITPSELLIGKTVDVAFRFPFKLNHQYCNLWFKTNRIENCTRYIYGEVEDTDELPDPNPEIIGTEVYQVNVSFWKNIRNKINYVEHNGKHYYYVTGWKLKNRTYHFKWKYSIPLDNWNVGGSPKKWDFMAKLSSDSIQTALDTGRYILLDPGWWNENWLYSKNLTVNNPRANYPYNLTVFKNDGHDSAADGTIDCEGHCEDDFSDIRFVYNNVTELDYWMENYTSGKSAKFWINGSSNNYTYFEMYYGNADVSNKSNGSNVFLFFDDFTGANVDFTSKWSSADESLYDIVNDQLRADKDLSTEFIVTQKTFPEHARYRCKIRAGSSANYNFYNHYNDDNSDFSSYTNGRVNLNPRVGSPYYLRMEYVDDSDTLQSDVNNPWNEEEWSLVDIRLHDNDLNFTVRDYDTDATIREYFDVNDAKSGGRRYIKLLSWDNNDYMYVDWWTVGLFVNRSHPGWSSIGAEQTSPANVPVNENPSPSDEATDIALNPRLTINVSDADNDLMNVSFWSNESGSWLELQTNASVTNGWFNYSTDWSEYGKRYYWSVNSTDNHSGASWDNDTYTFTTILSTEPSFSVPYPSNSSTNVCPGDAEIGITISDVDGDLMAICFRSNLSGTWDWFYTGVNQSWTLVNLTNGTYYISVPYFAIHNQDYYWNFTVTDGNVHNHSGWYVFTTSESFCGGGGGGSMSRDSLWVVGAAIGMVALSVALMKRRRKKG